MSLRDWAVYLLHNAALVEHALMVQYLYAWYSLNDSASGPSADNPASEVAVSSWGQVIRGIAVEEMGHLITVQNILRFIGGTPTFEREDFPIPTEVYPFPFQLERLTKDVLAKYVYAEMPEGDIPEDVIPGGALFTAAERAEIESRAKKSATKGGNFANHVGILYATLLNVFADPAFRSLASSGLPPASDTKIVNFQAISKAPWPHLLGNTTIVDTVNSMGVVQPASLKRPRLLWINSIEDVLQALSFIARQGEASDVNAMGLSHFVRFLGIYRSFPEDAATGWPTPPTSSVPKNPTTIVTPETQSSISYEPTQLWARLFDLRYRSLLLSLSHITAIQAIEVFDHTDAEQSTPTEEAQALVERIFNVMKDAPLNFSMIAKLLPQMPRKKPPTKEMAGAPFTMPYSTAIPNRPREQWQYHLDLLDSTETLLVEISKIVPDPAFPAFQEASERIADLRANDANWRSLAIGFLAKYSTT